MSNISLVLDFVGASGFVAAVGSVFGLGRLHQKVESQSDLIERLEEETRSTSIAHGAMAITLGRVEERISTIKDDLTEIKNAVRKD
jgi:hypothetical protein